MDDSSTLATGAPTPGLRLIEPTRSFRTVIVTAVVAVLVVAVGGLIVKAAGSAEMPLSIALNGLHGGVLGTLGDLLYTGLEPVVAIALTVVVTVVVLVVSRDLRIASTFAVTIAVSWLSLAVVKLMVHRPRPVASLLSDPYRPVQHDASYPSGHEAFITAVVMALILMTAPAARRVIVVVGAIVIVASALLLAIDGVHYLSDVAASIVWAAGVAPLVRAAWVGLVLPRLGFLDPDRRSATRYRRTS